VPKRPAAHRNLSPRTPDTGRLKAAGIGVIVDERAVWPSNAAHIQPEGDDMANDVFLYALSTCGHCKRTKQFLSDNDVEFDYIDVDLCQGEERTQTIEEVKKYNPNTTFPTVLVGDSVIVGFKEDELKKKLGL
jgi:glutaredoxin